MRIFQQLIAISAILLAIITTILLAIKAKEFSTDQYITCWIIIGVSMFITGLFMDSLCDNNN